MSGPTKTPLPPDTRLTLLTLGGWGLSYASADQALTPVFGPSKPTALLVYLAIAPGHTARREHLLDLLWADLDQDAAAHALRQTIWYIGRRTTPGVFASADGSLRLAIPVELDRERFLDAVARQDVETAVALYAGDFLPGFAAPGGAEFERWADLERHRLRAAFVRCAEVLCHRYLAGSRFREAIALARRVRDADSLAESGWRLLIEALGSAGDRIGAATEADALERLLQGEGREPEPATRAFLRSSRAGGAGGDAAQPQAATPTLVAELIGREREFGAIVEAWADAQRGRVRHLHLSAAAGLGKTRLLTDIRNRLRAGGAQTLLLRANPGERQVPFAFAADLAAAVARLPGAKGVAPAIAEALVGLNPALSERFPHAAAHHPTGADALRLRTIAVEETLRAAAEDGPVALLVDDLHWMDAASLQVLGGLITRLERERVLVVTTARPTGETAVARPDTLQYTLGPLDVAQVSALVASLGTLPDADWARELAPRLHTGTRGFPLLLLETLHLALEHDALRLSAGAWALGNLDALLALLASGTALRRRIEELSREQRWLLLVMATAGRALAFDTVRDVAPRPDEVLLAELRDMEQRGLVRSAAGAWLPGHDAVAETAAELAEEDARCAAHAALGRAYARWAPTAPALLPLAAQHLVAAGDVDAVGPLLAQAVRGAAARGDRRPPQALAQELLGEHGTAERVHRLRRLLPVHLRVGLTTPARMAAAVVLALAAVGTGAWGAMRPVPAPPDVVIVARIAYRDGSSEARALPVRMSEWHPDSAPVDLSHFGHPIRVPPEVTGPRSNALSFWSAPLRGWLAATPMPDSGGQDVFRVDSTGARRRLTAAPGDDGATSSAPDGSAVAITTARWNVRSLYDIAVVDVRTGAVRQLTRGNAWDAPPVWSEDGSRIAFLRRHTISHSPDSAARAEVCTIAPDGTRERCLLPSAGLVTSSPIWHRGDSALVTLASGDAEYAAHMDLRTGAVTRLRACPAVQTAGAAPWFTCLRGSDDSTRGAVAEVVPLASPARALSVRIGPDVERIAWDVMEQQPSPFVSRIAIALPETLQARVPFGARLYAVMSNGAVRLRTDGAWSTTNSLVATVDSTGTVVPHAPGRVTLRAALPGWRATAREIVVVPAVAPRTVRDERWADTAMTGWRTFGHPRPIVVSTERGPAFWNRGDGAYTSGAWSLFAAASSQGIGLEALMTIPADSGQWQSLDLRLSAEIDSTAAELPSSAPRDAAVPTLNHPLEMACTAGAPAGEGMAQRDRIWVYGAGEHTAFPSPGIRRGWHRLRLQILPDGRCGVALDGRPIWISTERLDLADRYRVVITGNSAWTRILVGPLQVWQGVRTDVDWTRIPTR